MRVLVTGGAGYIGSHTVIELVKHGHDVIVVDNLINSSLEPVKRVEEILGKSIPFHKVDCTNFRSLNNVFDQHDIDAVIHLAGLKSVSESIKQPLRYYQQNIGSTLTLYEVMQAKAVKRLVFSSSATVYGTPTELPLKETSPTGKITNPYGRTKFMIEQILQDVAAADPELEITILRYFNPIGADESGRIGEDPSGIPNNLLPYVSRVAVGALPFVHVYGNDYDTSDGTGIRDYVHVADLAEGHVAALENSKMGTNIYNLGTGKGTSVLELIKAFGQASGKPIPYKIEPRRSGDVAVCYADCTKAAKDLGWKTKKTINDACQDSWRWQSQNPLGYNDRRLAKTKPAIKKMHR